jgi:hypothetical protein
VSTLPEKTVAWSFCFPPLLAIAALASFTLANVARAAEPSTADAVIKTNTAMADRIDR